MNDQVLNDSGSLPSFKSKGRRMKNFVDRADVSDELFHFDPNVFSARKKRKIGINKDIRSRGFSESVQQQCESDNGEFVTI